jgi:hypothetical protein
MSLVETSCAAAILALAIAGLTNVAATSASLHKLGVQKAAAVRAVERQMAAVVASNFATLPATWNNVGFTAGLEGEAGAALQAVKGDADGLPGSIVVSAPTGKPTELLEILVRVDWQAPHGPAGVSRRLLISRIGTGS